MSKKKIAAFFSAALFLALCVIVAAAYFMDRDKALNDADIGYAKVSVDETKANNNEQDYVDNTVQKNDTAISKPIRIKNEGSIPVYVRVRIEFSSSDIRDITEVSYDLGSTYYKFDKNINEADFESGRDYFVNKLPDGWVYDNEYFYYTKPVEVGKSTEKLIDSFRNISGSNITVSDYDILVYAETVQIYDPSTGKSYEENHSSGYSAAWSNFLK